MATFRGESQKINSTSSNPKVLEVKVGATDMIPEYVHSLLEYVKSNIGDDKFPNLAPTEEELVNLLRYVLKVRCDQSRGFGNKGVSNLVLPAWFITQVNSLGVATNVRGTRILKYAGADVSLTPEQALDISLRLSWLGDFTHLATGACTTQDRGLGDPDVMMSGIVGDWIRTENDVVNVVVQTAIPLLGVELPDGEALLDLGLLRDVIGLDEARVRIISDPSKF